uniref:Uncharacterized protein n=1 Tax=Amphimedon queenslandica TaxID=400682 RepID=A0A1X7UUW7_AMPQE
MAAELAHKKSVRSGHRGTVTRKVTELETALGATPIDLEQLRAALAEKVAVLKDLDESILALLEAEAEIETDIEGAEDVRDTLRSALYKIDKAIGPSSGAPRGVSPTVGDTPSESVATKIKLPELTLTPFDGDYTKWKTFWDLFESAIHNRRDLSDINKFTYLRSLLIRSAKEAVAGLSLTSTNYQEAINILKKREAKVILDSGSQRSYVSQDLKKEKALKVKIKKSMSVAAFGSTTQREEEYDTVEICLQTEEGSITLRLLAVTLICGPIPAAPIEISKCYYEHLSNLDFAVPDEGEPQILIGLDYYWSVVSGEVI